MFQGAEQLFQWGRRYLVSSATAEGLRHEKMLFRANAGAYANAEDPLALYAERVVDLDLRAGTQMRELTKKVCGGGRGPWALVKKFPVAFQDRTANRTPLINRREAKDVVVVEARPLVRRRRLMAAREATQP